MLLYTVCTAELLSWLSCTCCMTAYTAYADSSPSTRRSANCILLLYTVLLNILMTTGLMISIADSEHEQCY